MKTLDKKLIDLINKKCNDNQGIWLQPFGIPDSIKELVVYSKWESGRCEGGNCWGGKAQYYSESMPDDHMEVLSLLLEEIAPKITYLQYKKIRKITHNNTEEEYEWYGNSTSWVIEYIVLSDLLAFLSNEVLV